MNVLRDLDTSACLNLLSTTIKIPAFLTFEDTASNELFEIRHVKVPYAMRSRQPYCEPKDIHEYDRISRYGKRGWPISTLFTFSHLVPEYK